MNIGRGVVTAGALSAAMVGVALFMGCRKHGGDETGTGTLEGENTGMIKIGYIVKQPEEPWFQNEWKFAEQAAADNGFRLIKIGATDGEKVLAAIDNLATMDAKGFVICTPDVRLGPAIKRKADHYHLKFMSVDDRFVGSDGKFMTDVHHLGISAYNIGKMVGKALYAEMQRRKWDVNRTGACVITFEELDTAKQRTDGAVDALIAAGFPKDRIFKASQKTSDVPGAFDAANVLLTQHPNIKYWLACGMNDSAVLGAVRATEQRGFGADHVIGIGINGTDCITEFLKPKPTGFYASVLLSPRKHGYQTALMVYKWITQGIEPPKETLTTGTLITRDNFRECLKKEGLSVK